MPNKKAQVALVAVLLVGFSVWAQPASGEGTLDSAKQTASDAFDAAKSQVSPPPPTLADKLKDAANKAGQQIQGYADQLAGQISKRLRRQATLHEGPHSHAGGHQHQQGSSQLDDKLDSARQLVQKIRERCLSGLEQQHNAREDAHQGHSARLQRSEYETGASERASSAAAAGRLAKLDELGDKVKNRTNDARELLQNIRLKCAEILGGNSNSHEHNNHKHNFEHDHHDHRDYKEHGNQDGHHQRESAREPHRLRRQVFVPGSETQTAAGQVQNTALHLFNSGQAALASFGEQVRSQTGAVVQQAQGLRDQLVASVDRQVASVNQQAPKRLRRQIQYPQLEQPAGPTGPSPVQPSASSAGGIGSGVMKYINDLGQQAAQAQAIQQILQAAGASGSQGPNAGAAPGSSAGSNVAQVLTQLADLIKTTQARAARLMESNQRSVEQTGQQTAEVARSATSGVQGAFAEMTQGLQRLAANNPNLMPDLKSLYQTLSARLSSAVNPAQQTAGANGLSQVAPQPA